MEARDGRASGQPSSPLAPASSPAAAARRSPLPQSPSSCPCRRPRARALRLGPCRDPGPDPGRDRFRPGGSCSRVRVGCPGRARCRCRVLCLSPPRRHRRPDSDRRPTAPLCRLTLSRC